MGILKYKYIWHSVYFYVYVLTVIGYSIIIAKVVGNWNSPEIRFVLSEVYHLPVNQILVLLLMLFLQCHIIERNQSICLILRFATKKEYLNHCSDFYNKISSMVIAVLILVPAGYFGISGFREISFILLLFLIWYFGFKIIFELLWIFYHFTATIMKSAAILFALLLLAGIVPISFLSNNTLSRLFRDAATDNILVLSLILISLTIIAAYSRKCHLKLITRKEYI